MIDLLYQIAKPLFFLLPPETAHRLVLFFLAIPPIAAIFRRALRLDDPALQRIVFGITFPNPVGLAAGFDKDGRHIRAMAVLGFGFVEIGTVTPRPQEGNSRPRLFRLIPDRALINRMGFNNAGMEVVAANLRKRPAGIIVAANIGKNKDTPNDQAAGDYLACFHALYPFADFFVVNVSSPNTPGLRALQDAAPLAALMEALQRANREKPAPKPILLKIAPDLDEGQLDEIAAIVSRIGIAGIVATNTTVERPALKSRHAAQTGGLSGAPLRDQATRIIHYLHSRLPDVPIIGVGGIASPADALEKIEAGASLVQLYTGLIFEGPGLVRRIKEGLSAQ